MTRRVRHIVNLSGGKDSTALAIYLRDRIPDLEYVFCDTEHELPETYEYLDRLEVYLGRRIERLTPGGRGFDHWLTVYRGYLPSTQMRWCTKHLKIQPFEEYIGDDQVISYIGIRADEDRAAYHSTKPSIKAVYPLKDSGLTRRDVHRILEESGLGIPSYYRWRSRSGCYFCFFQQKIEWLGLAEHHPERFQRAQAYEKIDSQGVSFTWNGDESLAKLISPQRAAEIRKEHEQRMARLRNRYRSHLLIDLLGDSELFSAAIEECELHSACAMCE
ncbi:MAG: phosphoadenosine phosphosulfate reductase family protein [Anaerolineae bacterium]